MNNNLFSMAVITLLCASCSSDLPEMVSGNNQDAPKTNLEYALKYAEDLIGHIDPMTRGSHRHANVQFVCNQATRAGEQDTLLYLVNYEDDMGFALLDAEGKNGGVYAISPKGHLEFSDSIDNPTLAHFFRKVESISSVTLPDTDSITIIGWEHQYPIMIYDESKPFLCSRYASWSSNYVAGAGPNGGLGNVTTAATALAKMLAYYLHPNTINGTAINWNYISGPTVSQSTVYHLLRTLNNSSFLEDTPIAGSISSGDEGRMVSYENIIDAFKKLGFGEDPFVTFNANNNLFVTRNNINNMKVVLGSKQRIEGSCVPKGPIMAFARPMDNIDSGMIFPYNQFWIIDGFIDRGHVLPNYIPKPGDQSLIPTLYHCIWGLDDYLDGYYAFVVEGYIDNNYSYIEKIKDPASGVYKDTLISEEMEDQYLFPNPGGIGGFEIQPIPQP